MSLASMWWETVHRVQTSPLLHGAIGTGKALLIVAGTLLVLTAVMWTLHRWFVHHTGIRKAYKFCIYLLTMLGVVVLLFAGILGLILPVIPGLLLLLGAFLLFRRYYKNAWMDRQIHHLGWRLRFKRAVKKKLRKTKIGKALRHHGKR